MYIEAKNMSKLSNETLITALFEAIVEKEEMYLGFWIIP